MVRISLALLVSVASAAAQPTDPVAEARAAADAGAARFREGDYPGAIKHFEAAYQLQRDASHLFNIAQAYRHAKDCVHAAEYYRRFLAEVPDPPNAPKIRAWFEAEETCARARRAAKVEAQREPEPPRRDATRTDKSGAPITALALGGAGVVALAVAGGFALHARGLARDRDRELAACTLDAPCSAGVINDLDHRGGRANVIAIASAGVGIAALAVGATLWGLRRGVDRRRQATIAPLPGGALVVATLPW